MALIIGAVTSFIGDSVFAQRLIYPQSGGKKTKTLQTKGEFTKTKIDKGLNYYYYQGLDEVSGSPQTVYVTEIDLDSDRYNIMFHYGGDSTSAAAIQYGAVAAINATYETDASYIRTEGKNHHEVTIPSGHLRFWKHNGAIVGDGGNKVTIVNGAPGQEAAPEGGEKAIALYKSLSEKFGLDITASGGVSSMADIHQLRQMDLYGAIIGKAYYTGAIDLKKALEVAK